MKKPILFLAVLSLLITLVFFYLKQDFKSAAPTLYYNAHIITVDDALPSADAMLIKNGRITAIGKNENIPRQDISKLEKIDLKGATVMPGFIDVHTHFALSMFLSEMQDLSGFKHKNNKEVWAYFEKIVQETPAGEWIICKGIDPVLTNHLIPPDLNYLDSVAPNNPVVILSQSLHDYWANTRAFKKAGIDKNTPNPSISSYYEKGEDGNLSGHIVEQEAFKAFTEVLTKEVLTGKLLSQASRKVMNEYAKNGNTSIVSTGLSINDAKPLILMEHLSAEKPTLLGSLLEKFGQLPTRTPTPRHFIYMRHDRTGLLPKKRSAVNYFYDIIGIKHWYDGSPYIGSMYMDSAYLDTKLTTDILHIPKASRGKALIGKEDLKTFIKKYHQEGWQIAIHTQGDAAIREVVDAFELLDPELDYTNSRHRLEHCLLLPKTDLPRLKKLNLHPSFHINHLYYYGDSLYTEILGPTRTEQLLPLGSSIQEGIVSTLHADQPMFESLPFRLMQTAVERQTKSGKNIGADERISLMQAIRALTINAAWQIHLDDQIGSLEKGKFADFIILDKNPFEVPVQDLQNIQCVATYVNGNLVKE